MKGPDVRLGIGQGGGGEESVHMTLNFLDVSERMNSKRELGFGSREVS